MWVGVPRVVAVVAVKIHAAIVFGLADVAVAASAAVAALSAAGFDKDAVEAVDWDSIVAVAAATAAAVVVVVAAVPDCNSAVPGAAAGSADN